jgi:hypothetical protein
MKHRSVRMNPYISDAHMICILSVMLCFRVNAFDFHTVTQVTTDVIRKYNSACVYLMYSENQQGKRPVLEFYKYLRTFPAQLYSKLLDQCLLFFFCCYRVVLSGKIEEIVVRYRRVYYR